MSEWDKKQKHTLLGTLLRLIPLLVMALKKARIIQK